MDDGYLIKELVVRVVAIVVVVGIVVAVFVVVIVVLLQLCFEAISVIMSPFMRVNNECNTSHSPPALYKGAFYFLDVQLLNPYL